MLIELYFENTNYFKRIHIDTTEIPQILNYDDEFYIFKGMQSGSGDEYIPFYHKTNQVYFCY